MGQITVLNKHSSKRKNDHYKFLAAIQGIDLDKESENKGTNKEKGNTLEFQDPSAYEHMTDEEKNELTKKMMGGHRLNIKKSGF